MRSLRFSVSVVPFSRHPSFGADHLMSRLWAGDLPSFPLLPPCPAVGPAHSCVVAGQQPMLLTGPLFTILKAASCVGLSRRLTESTRSPIRPVFWIAAEDHDVLEVNRVYVAGRKLVCPYPGSLRRGTVPPVGAISLTGEEKAIRAFCRDVLPEGAYRSEVLAQLEKTDFGSYATQFRDLLLWLFESEGLTVVFPEQFREKGAPVLARAVEAWPELSEAFRCGADRLRACGFEPPLKEPRLFELAGGARRALVFEGKYVQLSDTRLSLQEAAERVRDEPERFSPGAALRPVVQDFVLPVCATVAGPTELLYLWQIRELYRLLGVKASYLVARLSATFLDGRTVKKLRQVGVDPEEVFSVPQRLAQWEQHASAVSRPELAEAAQLGERFLTTLQGLRTPANQRWLDRTLRSLRSAHAKALRHLESDLREAASATGRRLRSIHNAVMPRGMPQERALNVLEFYVRYGRDFVRAVCEDLDPFSKGHQVAWVVRDEERRQ